MANEPRVPFGNWKPSTPEEDLAMTDFENDETLRREVQRDVEEFAKRIQEPTQYKVGGKVEELDPKVVRGLLEAKEE